MGRHASLLDVVVMDVDAYDRRVVSFVDHVMEEEHDHDEVMENEMSAMKRHHRRRRPIQRHSFEGGKKKIGQKKKRSYVYVYVCFYKNYFFLSSVE